MKPLLTIDHLIREAKIFCDFMSQENHPELVGVTDGKAVGTYGEIDDLALYVTEDELFALTLELMHIVREAIICVWREVAADAVGKGVCVYTQRLYEGYDKLYHKTSGRDVYGRSDR